MSTASTTHTYNYYPGTTPLLISVPHAGIQLLPGMEACLSLEAACLPDTDWRVDELYAWARKLGAGLLVANYSRYVVDLNRPADDHSLYENKTTGLFPERTFTGEPVWTSTIDGMHSREWILTNIWHSYHQKISTELNLLKEKYGYALLLDAHSIASQVPGLFQGVLPDFNLGSYDARSAAASLIGSAYASLDTAKYSRVLDGRFKGGAITRGFGQPENNIHALQLELSQSTYLDSAIKWPQIDAAKQAQIQPVLYKLITAMLGWSP